MIGYDVESFPNFFSLDAIHMGTGEHRVYEISDRRNDSEYLMEWFDYVAINKYEMVGFNNIAYDYLLIHEIMRSNGLMSFEAIYDKSQSIIHSDDRFGQMIWPSDRFIDQIDLFKIHHFDNMARSTSLKALQVNMRSESVEDTPIPFGTWLTHDQKDKVLHYNAHDTEETVKFAHLSKDQIEFRRYLSKKYRRDFMNHNDTKIGKDFFIMELEKVNPQACYSKVNGKRQINQTQRSQIHFKDVIFPYIQFDHPEFQRILDWYKEQVILRSNFDTEIKLKGFFKDVSCTVNGFEFDFGVGGIHGSLKNQIVREDETHSIIDIDVKSYYPNIAIKNKNHPAHLGEVFCDIYQDVYTQRASYKKGTAENGMLKLALNGVYGDSNNKYSPFYDPQYTMTITVNGQLLLCMLAEKLMTLPGLEMIQINTDGLSIKVPRTLEPQVEAICKWWEDYTLLELEDVRYSMMAIRDVNNYIAVTTDGKRKLKGTYETALPGDRAPLGWHQDTSALIVSIAAEKAIVDGIPIRDTIYGHTDPFDFMCRAKVGRADQLVSRLNGADTPMQRITRYFVSKTGGSLVKISPPVQDMTIGNFKRANGVSKEKYLHWHNVVGNEWNVDIHTKNKSVYEIRNTSINTGWKATECNKASNFNWSNLEYEFYIKECEKIVNILIV